ncbi:MAG: hypothetical protein RLZZ621_891, partial [Gemmatimonadota bacterium]
MWVECGKTCCWGQGVWFPVAPLQVVLVDQPANDLGESLGGADSDRAEVACADRLGRAHVLQNVSFSVREAPGMELGEAPLAQELAGQ